MPVAGLITLYNKGNAQNSLDVLQCASSYLQSGVHGLVEKCQVLSPTDRLHSQHKKLRSIHDACHDSVD